MILLYLLGSLAAIVHTVIVIHEIVKERKRLHEIRQETEKLRKLSKFLDTHDLLSDPTQSILSVLTQK